MQEEETYSDITESLAELRAVAQRLGVARYTKLGRHKLIMAIRDANDKRLHKYANTKIKTYRAFLNLGKANMMGVFGSGGRNYYEICCVS